MYNTNKEMDSTNKTDQAPTIKMLDQGTYGCVFRPGLTCSGMIDETKTNITKIQKKKDKLESNTTILFGDHSVVTYMKI